MLSLKIGFIEAVLDLLFIHCSDVDEKLSEGEASPPSEDSLGRRKRKPSRYHDSMFDIPTNLLNINRTINPEVRHLHYRIIEKV